MKRTTLYTKQFSHLEGLQEAAVIWYNLLEEEPPGSACRLEIQEEGGGLRLADRFDRLFPSRDEAVRILTYLYENAVTATAWRAVVEDLLAV